MTRVLLCTTFILISLLVPNVDCEEDDNSLWESVKKAWNTFTDKMRQAFNDLMEEFKARSKDIKSWSQEAWDNFKRAWTDSVNSNTVMSSSEKEEMNNFIERLQMPEEGSEQKNER